jgi:chromate transporter
VFNGFYRAGALVFGGGHVVLPLLEAEVVGNGWLDADRFLAGYGAAQAVPGPLFTFAAFLGAALDVEPSGWTGAAVALVAIFLPSFLLVYAALPFWTRLRASRWAAGALAGINCAVVGLLLAALYDPVFTRAVAGPWDVLAALLALIALIRWQLAPWLVVAVGAAAGLLLSGLG